MTDAPVTVLLRAWQAGEASALDRLMPVVYAELYRLAMARMHGERSGHTWSPTELLSEAFLRLSGARTDFQDRAHFFAVAARIMRRILVDHARASAAQKRGGRVRAVTLDEQLIGGGRPEQLVALDDALAALADVDARKAEVVELRYFAGMTQQEIAQAVGVHVNTVARDLRLAEAWIHRQLLEAD
ncbi:RNA polymerase sigma factor [Enhygromyxa salina]|uniref:RNA polymerase sigma factor n=1 Tax=Enhygromyxa salina TaxID=215803 RepID=A0A2S9XEK3_9BACT|nr:ECF-type sigma factor [Enhygromyxa salina]PRP91101.1 RNA polymerase sigma factor [Enhygromyxa salina]